MSPRWNWGLDDYHNAGFDNVKSEILKLGEGRGAFFKVGHTPEAQRKIANWPREPDLVDWDDYDRVPYRASTLGVPGFGVLKPMWKGLLRDQNALREKMSDDTLKNRASARRFIANSPVANMADGMIAYNALQDHTNRQRNADIARRIEGQERQLRDLRRTEWKYMGYKNRQRPDVPNPASGPSFAGSGKQKVVKSIFTASSSSAPAPGLRRFPGYSLK